MKAQNQVHLHALLLAGVSIVSILAGCTPFSGGPGTGMRRSYDAPAGRLHYWEVGAGPPVVLIHGGQMDHRIWDGQVKRLRQSHRVIAYDVRGFGTSQQPSRVYCNYQELRGLLDHLGIPKATLVGLSLGGSIAIDFAIAYPERVDKLVLVAPGMSGFDWSADFRRMNLIIEAMQAEDVESTVRLWLADPMMAPAMENPRTAPTLERYVRDNMPAWLMNPYLERELQPKAAARLGEIRSPTLVIVGDRDDADILRISEKLEREVKGATRLFVKGAGHIVNMEKPDEFDRHLAEFLAR